MTLDVHYTRTLCLGLWVAHFLCRGTYTMLPRKFHPDFFCFEKSPQLFLLRYHMKRRREALGGLFQLVASPENDMCQ